jgi:NADH-quinone oxidoreductase subunit G
MSAFKPSKIAAVVESMGDLEALYTLSTVLKFYGSSDIQYSNTRLTLNLDLPLFFNLNRNIDSLEELKNLILIGSNPRFEASIINTSLLKNQLARALSYITIAPFADLKLKQKHEGNGLRGLIALVENRINSVKTFYFSENPAIILGAESLKGKNGDIIQNLVRFLGKKFYTKTLKGDRLGILQANITSLNFANLGLDIGVRSALHHKNLEDRKINNLFVVQPYKISPKK